MIQTVPGQIGVNLIKPEWHNWVKLFLATPVVLWSGWSIFVRAWQSLVNKNMNMFTLLGLGIGVAYIYSLIAAVMPMIFPTALRNQNGFVAAYFEAAAMITTLFL